MTTLSSPDPVWNLHHCPKRIVFLDNGLVVNPPFEALSLSLLGLLTTFENCSICFLNKKIVKPFSVPPNARTVSVLVHVAFGDVLCVVQCFDQGVVFYDSPGPGLDKA